MKALSPVDRRAYDVIGRSAGRTRRIEWESNMGDVVMGLVILAFFFLCVGYVSWCGRIIGPDPEELDASAAPPAAEPTEARAA